MSLATAFMLFLLGFFGGGGGLGVFFFSLFWILHFKAWLNIHSPKISEQDKRNLDCSRHSFTKVSRTQLLPRGRSFEPTLIFSISILIKPSSSILLSSSYSKIPKRWLCQLPSLEFKAFLGEETFQSVITTQNLHQRLLESWNYQWLPVNNCWSKWWIKDNPSQAILLWEWEKQLEGINN